MKAGIFSLLLFFGTAFCFGQEVVKDTVKNGIVNETETDSITFNYELEDLVISNVNDELSADEKKRLLILKRRVLKVYPYAKIAADRLTLLNANMAKLKTDKEKKKYSKIVEKYLEDEFEAQLFLQADCSSHFQIRSRGENYRNLLLHHSSHPGLGHRHFRAFYSRSGCVQFTVIQH